MHATIPSDGLPVPQRYWAIAAVGLALVIAVMDSAIANVALPTIANDLHASPALSIWIVNGYQLAITISLLPLAALGDIVGYRRVYTAGLVLFTFASLFCALAHTLPLLALARVVQGFGAAGIMSVNSALVRFIYPHRMLGRGISINALVVAVSAAIGPTVASAILALAPWPWLFAVNIPIGIVAFLIARRSLPYTPLAQRGFDIPGAILVALMFGALIASIDALGHGETFMLFGAEVAATALLAFLAIRREANCDSPMLPVDLLRIPIFALSIVTSICSFAAQMLALVSLPLPAARRTALHRGRDRPVAHALAHRYGLRRADCGRLADRYPAGLLGGIGLVIFAAGLLSLAFLPAQPTVYAIAWRTALAGAGFGLFQSPNNRAMIGSTPRERSGGASGMLGTARLLGTNHRRSAGGAVFVRAPQTGAVLSLEVAVGFALVAALVSALRLFDRTGLAASSTFGAAPRGDGRPAP